jgi:hypothetical protein
MSGLGLALAVFLILAGLGATGGTSGGIALIFVQFFAMFAAGYVAGRLGVGSAPLNGGISSLLVFFVAVMISLGGGASPGIAPLLFLGTVAAVLGSAGGVLAQSHHP